jgi:hypothetical protein
MGIHLNCETINSCTGTQSMPNTGGTPFLAFDSKSPKIPLMKLDATTALLSPVVYMPPKSDDQKKKGAAGEANAVQQSATTIGKPPATTFDPAKLMSRSIFGWCGHTAFNP